MNNLPPLLFFFRRVHRHLIVCGMTLAIVALHLSAPPPAQAQIHFGEWSSFTGENRVRVWALFDMPDGTKRYFSPVNSYSDSMLALLQGIHSIRLDGDSGVFLRELTNQLQAEGYEVLPGDSEGQIHIELTIEHERVLPHEHFAIWADSSSGQNDLHVNLKVLKSARVKNAPVDVLLYRTVVGISGEKLGFYAQETALVLSELSDSLDSASKPDERELAQVELLMPCLFGSLRNFDAVERAMSRLDDNHLKAATSDIIMFADSRAIPMLDRMVKGRVFSVRQHLKDAIKQLKEIEKQSKN